MRKLWLGTFAGAVLSVTPLLAQDGDLFAKLDANKDGFITADEAAGDRQPLFERLLRIGDKNGDKKLSQEEFTAAQKESDQPRQTLGQPGFPGRPGGGLANPRELFARQDVNKDGKISKDEAQGFLKEGFARLDANGDGFITEDEFPRGPRGAPGAGNGPNPQQLEAMFDRTDANSDGKVVKDEMPEGLRERFAQALERFGGDSMNKEQFVRFMTFVAQQNGGRPGAPGPGGPMGGRPLIAVLDTNGDGELSAAEIEAASKVLLALDKNGDGKLTQAELFPNAPDSPPAGRRPNGRPGDALRERLASLDTNKDGKISKDEARGALKETFDTIDANKDGFLDETEMRQAFGQRLREEGGNQPNRPRLKGKAPDAPPKP